MLLLIIAMMNQTCRYGSELMGVLLLLKKFILTCNDKKLATAFSAWSTGLNLLLILYYVLPCISILLITCLSFVLFFFFFFSFIVPRID